MRKKGWKVTKRCVFLCFCGPGGSKSRLANTGCGAIRSYQGSKSAHRWSPHDQSTFGSWRLWREGHFEVKMCKTPQLQNTAHSTLYTPHSLLYTPHSTLYILDVKLWKKCAGLWCEAYIEVKLLSLLAVEMSKNARCCGTKHISNSKCEKRTTFAPLLEVQT